MRSYHGFHHAIIDLHKKGYVEDFVLFGDDLLWIQEKYFISENNFSISECHRFSHPYGTAGGTESGKHCTSFIKKWHG